MTSVVIRLGWSSPGSSGIARPQAPGRESRPVAERYAEAVGWPKSAIVHWNAYGGAEAGDLLSVDPAAVRGVFDVAIVGLLSAVHEALPDLKVAEDGAVLVTNGAFGETTPQIDALAVNLKTMGLALAN